MRLVLSIAGGIIVGGIALLIIVGVARSHAPIQCPYLQTPTGQPLTGSDAAWARAGLGNRVVDHCWPGTPR